MFSSKAPSRGSATSATSGGRRRLFVSIAIVVIGLSAATPASGAGTRPVTATTVTESGATCTDPPVQKGNVEIRHCSGGVETWSGDITGLGVYSYDSVTNLKTGVRVVMNGVETIYNACVLGVCGGDLYSRWNEQDLKSGTTHIEQSFQGGTGALAKAHGSIRNRPVTFAYSGQVGI